MPDVDIVHDQVKPKFRAAYRQLCERTRSVEEQSESIAKGLRNTLKKDANSAVEFILRTLTRAAEEFDVDKPDFGVALSRFIDGCARECVTNSRYKSLAVEALKACLKHGENLQFTNHNARESIRDFVNRVLAADFVESMNLIYHHSGASSEDIRESLQEAEPHLEREIEYIVSQILRKGSAAKLRKRPKRRGPKPDFSEEDISIPNA